MRLFSVTLCLFLLRQGHGWKRRPTVRGHLFNRAAPAPGEAAIGFTVEVIEETITAAEAAGGRVVAPVQTVSDHGIKAAYIADPEGHIIELLQLSK